MRDKLTFLRLDDTPLYEIRSKSILEPLGLEYLIGNLENKNNYDIKLIDLNVNDLFDEDWICNSSFVFITLPTPLYPQCKNIIRRCKEINPDGIVVVGGPHPSAMPEECEQDLGADIVIVREGETSINIILNQSRELLRDPKYPILGLNQFYYESDLDKIKYPDRNYVNKGKYSLDCGDQTNQMVASVITSRSCFYQCVYCASKTIFGNKLRLRSVENIMGELRLLKKQGYNKVIFLDDTFTHNRNRVIELCTKMIREEINMKWWADTRVDKVDSDILEAMKAAGCQMIVYGIESGNQKILDRIKKNITLEQAEKAIKLTKEVGIKMKANFMLGHLEETIFEIRDTIAFAKKIQTDRTSFYINIPLPGTQNWKHLKEDIGPKSYDRMKWYGESVPSICELTSGQLKEFQKKAYEEMENG